MRQCYFSTKSFLWTLNKFRFKLQVNREIVLQTACIVLASLVSHAVIGKTKKQEQRIATSIYHQQQ